MPTQTEVIDRIAPTQRPTGRACGYHRWSNLLFLHWRVPAELVQPLLPTGLTLDTWEGDAWVGLVPFHMSGVRPWWSPAVPWVSTFHETNVRTYVQHRGSDPGVWFFSLEASNALAVLLARWGWHLPYHRARMSLRRELEHVRYASRRETVSGAACEIETVVSETLLGSAVPGTLEHFLIERYILYAASRSGKIWRGRVHHVPYQLRDARVVSCRDTLVAAAGIPVTGDPCHAVFCDGVQVEVFPLVDVGAK